LVSNNTEALRMAAELDACPSINYSSHAAELRRQHAEIERLEAERDAMRASLCAVCARGIGEPDPESLSRQMFVARLENMQKGGGALTASAVLALLSDCDMLALRNWSTT